MLFPVELGVCLLLLLLLFTCCGLLFGVRWLLLLLLFATGPRLGNGVWASTFLGVTPIIFTSSPFDGIFISYFLELRSIEIYILFVQSVSSLV